MGSEADRGKNEGMSLAKSLNSWDSLGWSMDQRFFHLPHTRFVAQNETRANKMCGRNSALGLEPISCLCPVRPINLLSSVGRSRGSSQLLVRRLEPKVRYPLEEPAQTMGRLEKQLYHPGN